MEREKNRAVLSETFWDERKNSKNKNILIKRKTTSKHCCN